MVNLMNQGKMYWYRYQVKELLTSMLDVKKDLFLKNLYQQ